NLLRVVDFLPGFYGVGLLFMLFTRQHRRVGDLLAGTLLVREEKIDLAKYAPPAQALPAAAGAALSAAEVELLLSYLSRTQELTLEARTRLTGKMLRRFASDEQRAALGDSLEGAEAWLKQRATAGA